MPITFQGWGCCYEAAVELRQMHRSDFAERLVVLLFAAFWLEAAWGQSSPSVGAGDWERLMPKVREVLRTEFPNEKIEEHYRLAIAQKADVTGDGMPEALVYLGTGGAYTNGMTVMRIENEQPVVARFRQKDGKVSSIFFLEGSSVRHGNHVELRAAEHAVYSGRWTTEGSGRIDHCTGEAYQWNSHSKTFDYSPRLSGDITKSWCRTVRLEINGPR